MTDMETSVSRCTVPQSEPYELHLLNTRDSSGRVVKIVKDEWAAALQDATDGPVAEDELYLRRSALRRLITRATQGRATMKHEVGSGHDLEYVSLDPKLWELRTEVGNWIFRQYHGEPAKHPTLLVAVKAHRKFIRASKAETNDEQDEHIIDGSNRYTAQAYRNWGWPVAG